MSSDTDEGLRGWDGRGMLRGGTWLVQGFFLAFDPFKLF